MHLDQRRAIKTSSIVRILPWCLAIVMMVSININSQFAVASTVSNDNVSTATAAATATTTTTSASTTATLSECLVMVDGDSQWLDAYNIKGSNYLMLRDVAQLFSGTPSEFSWTWNAQSKQIEITTGQSNASEKYEYGSGTSGYYRQKAYLSRSKVIIDGQVKTLDSYVINNKTYFSIKALSDLSGAEVKWVPEDQMIAIRSKVPKNVTRVNVKSHLNENNLSEYHNRWQSVARSYLYQNSDATLTVIDIDSDDAILIENYDQNFKQKQTKSLALELPIFGGFYSGKTYNYLVFGNSNEEENSQKEVIRVVKYDKSFKRIGSVSIKGGDCFTTVPFDAGSSRMDESGRMLILHTGRERYTSSDGLNHQSQLTVRIDTEKMTVTNDLGLFQTNHVSHSFDQYVKFDGEDPVFVDHGDAYPRSVVLTKFQGESASSVDLFKIPGTIGANQTGVEVGGFEVSESHYLVAMNSVDHSKVKEYTSYDLEGLTIDQRDILITSLPKTSMDDSQVQTTVVGKYTGTKYQSSKPKLVHVHDNLFAVLWEEFTLEGRSLGLKVAWLDAKGVLIKEVAHYRYFHLSDMQPIVQNQHITWFVNNQDHRMFYTISTEL